MFGFHVGLWGKQAKSPEARVKELERKEREGKRKWDGVEEWDNRRKWEGKEEKGVSKESNVRWSKEGWSEKTSSSMWKNERIEERREQTKDSKNTEPEEWGQRARRCRYWPLYRVPLFVFYILYPCILQPPPKLFIHSDNPLFISSRTEARRTTQRKRPGEIINSTLAQYDW